MLHGKILNLLWTWNQLWKVKLRLSVKILIIKIGCKLKYGQSRWRIYFVEIHGSQNYVFYFENHYSINLLTTVKETVS